MTTKVKVAFREQSKGVVAEVAIDSDELSTEEVLEQSKKLYEEASKYSANKSFNK